MYKSSFRTYFIKYLLPIGTIAALGQVTYLFNYESGVFFNKTYLLLSFIPVTYVVVQIIMKLKLVEANETGIIVKTLLKKEEIKYQDIEWISKFDIETPFNPTIKYYDQEKMKTKKVCFIPSRQDQGFLNFGNDDMTNYIKEQIERLNPNYSKENEPSKIKTIFAVIVVVAIYLAIAFYYNPNFI
jgi:hypothetical protein